MSLVSLSKNAHFVTDVQEEEYEPEEQCIEQSVNEVRPSANPFLDLSENEEIDQGLLEQRKKIQELQANAPVIEYKAQNTQYDPRADIPASSEEALAKIARLNYILENFKLERNQQIPRQVYVEQLKNLICDTYLYSQEVADILLNLFGPSEFLEFVRASEKQRPLTIRVNTLKARRKEVAALLAAKGVELEPIEFCQDGLTVFSSQVPLGATNEYLRGLYIIQDAASFIPVLALNPQPNERICDMAAAPGGKTTHICQLMQNTGVLVANDSEEKRLDALQANVSRMSCLNVIITNFDGRKLPFGQFDRILLDAPCTGLGVICKDPRTKTARDFGDLNRLQTLQRELLWRAIDMLGSGQKSARRVVYSTCSVTVAENEAVVDYVVKKRGDCEIVDSGIEIGKPGMTGFMGKQFSPRMKYARRFYPHLHNVQGFFVCCIEKKAGAKAKARGIYDKEQSE